MSSTPLGVIRQGDSLDLQFLCQTSSGAPEVLTGATLVWSLARVIDRGRPVLTKTPVVTDAAGGVCRVSIDAGDLATPGTYYHELEIILATGASATYADGTLIVEPSIRPTT
jgi:hypothetical protein